MTAWDNVVSIADVTIDANNGTSTSGTVFTNGNHQLPIFFKVLFNLKDVDQPGPTDQDVINALTWINYDDATPVSGLSIETGSSGEYCLYYNDGSNPSSSETDNLESDYSNSVAYKVKATSGTAGGKYKLAIKLQGERSTDGPFIYQSNSTSSSLSAFFNVNLIPNKTYAAPTDPGSDSHRLKFDNVTYSYNYSNNGRQSYASLSSRLYRVYIDTTPDHGSSFYLSHIGDIENYHTTKDNYFAPCRMSESKDKTMWNYFKQLVFWSMDRRNTADNADINNNSSIQDGQTITKLYMWDDGGGLYEGGTITSKGVNSLQPYSFVMAWASIEYENTSDGCGPFGQNTYTVPFLDNYGNRLSIIIGFNSDSTPTINSVA
ncbi:hypothetical protein [Pseudomonas chlororaphis]|uniref:hypothetical protein n=1 Tax=Pseudomonas chlororaphis TaxID=587753 RepID=UPI0007BB97C3|nr:hypothetical protein [Pseudomonas chlororaphis]AZC64541.1 hypothetical protein C4K33_4057 [Pseudomonas chlororaphis subsp. piscium]AZC96846.1 hypothetical protein C4K28_4126 [Pseudomonas chlororaphis subsp. piscium]KZO47916.1 hypothetical protein PCL1391_3779 [Pseudomonas chlororaphis subsp. piscium]MBP5070327.1 hypothetical protein [Pseudomonas chlororaphis]QTT88039.1 hypothetical protein HUT28_11830 [Pseudomonas chlororaphis]